MGRAGARADRRQVRRRVVITVGVLATTVIGAGLWAVVRSWGEPDAASRFHALEVADARVRADLKAANLETLRRDYSVTCKQMVANHHEPGSEGSSVYFEVAGSEREVLSAFDAQGHSFEPDEYDPEDPTQGMWTFDGQGVQISVQDRDSHTIVVLGLHPGTSECLTEDGGVYPP